MRVLALVMAGCSSMESLKFDFLSQPAEVVLSVIDKMQCIFGRDDSIISIHGPMTEARCSNMFRVALNWRYFGMKNLQARPRFE